MEKPASLSICKQTLVDRRGYLIIIFKAGPEVWLAW